MLPRVLGRPPVSLPERIAAELRGEILDGAVRPGERLKEEHLCARFGAGRHTVRAAIRQLVEWRMVTHERNRGARVPKLSQEWIDDVYDFRAVLEPGCLRAAFAHGADFAEVERAVAALERIPADASWRDANDAHRSIHHAIVAAAGNDRLLEAYTASEGEMQLLFVALRPSYSIPEVIAIHQDLLAEIRLGERRGVRALAADIEHTRQTLQRALHRDLAS